MKNRKNKENGTKKAYIDMTAHKTLFDDVRETPEFKKGYEKEMISELIDEIKSARIKKHITQQGLASLIGTRQQVIARLEKEGAQDMKLSTYLNIVNALGLDLKKMMHC
jgi:DNA-binding XRE family transcriptional regulator